MLEAGATLVAVFLGVFLAELAAARRRRRELIETAVFELAPLVPHVTFGLTSADTDRPVGSDWWAKQERVTTLLSMIRTLSRGRLVKDGDAIKLEADDLNARITAAWLDTFNGKTIRTADVFEMTTNRLATAVFGGGKTLDTRVRFYRQHGYGAAPTEAQLSALQRETEPG